MQLVWQSDSGHFLPGDVALTIGVSSGSGSETPADGVQPSDGFKGPLSRLSLTAGYQGREPDSWAILRSCLGVVAKEPSQASFYLQGPSHK